MGFNIQDYLRDNNINLGTVTKEVGSTPYKGGHNDIRKTNYDVKLTDDGKLDLYTHTTTNTTHKWRLDESLDCGCDKKINELQYNDSGELNKVRVWKTFSDYSKLAKIGDYIWTGSDLNKFKHNKKFISKIIGFNNNGPILTPFGRTEPYQVLNTNLTTVLVESVLTESKNCPTDSSKWSYWKSQAKKKFDVYPSAYANGWAAKQYKAAGGKWKVCKD